VQFLPSFQLPSCDFLASERCLSARENFAESPTGKNFLTRAERVRHPVLTVSSVATRFHRSEAKLQSKMSQLARLDGSAEDVGNVSKSRQASGTSILSR
jgi:hypothetical protein